ncbi:MAG TPA: CdaR family protein [Terriglobales bacterium]|jgi:YbbR domain-containing protein|nr:CdaR family protein [Terriglobales bacterium]
MSGIAERSFSQRGFLQRAFVHNIGLKVVSLLLAIALWFAVARSPVAEVEMRVPIEFHNLPDNLEIDSASFTEAQIRVRGPERVIHRLQIADVRAEIDLASVAPGERTFDLTARHVHVPEDLEVVQIIPGQFHLSFDNRATRVIEIRPRVIGTFASGMQVGQWIADPPTVMITGPRRRVEAVEAAVTDPVDASGTMTRASFVTQAYVPDPLIQVVHPTPVRVTVIMERSEFRNK